MAKPKFPKQSNGVSEAVSTTSSLPPITTSAPVTTHDGSAAAPAPQARKTEPRKPAKKPEIVKTEPRANLVPINLEEEIRRLAYLLSERRGFESGHETEDWLAAEREIRLRYHQQSA